MIPPHPILERFQFELNKCLESHLLCEANARNLSSLAARIVDDLASLHLDLEAIDILEMSLTTLPTCSPLKHTLQRLLTQVYLHTGDLQYALQHSDQLDILSRRTHLAVHYLTGGESHYPHVLQAYLNEIHQRFEKITNLPLNQSTSISSKEEAWISLLMGELTGRVTQRPSLTDLTLTTPLHFSTHNRFYLAVTLMKLGLHDLGMRQLASIATPWEAPLYRILARLAFPSFHTSIRSLAQSVNVFLQHGELMLNQRHQLSSPMMTTLCESFNDVAIAVQALPLLHLAGYSSPRPTLAMGQSPIALPALLSEVFTGMCSVNTNYSLPVTNHQVKQTITIGVVSGSFDGLSGRIVLGILQGIIGINSTSTSNVRFVAMCFPTPRDVKTDLAVNLFAANINLPSKNKSLAVQRIQQLNPDVIIFADAGYDSRVFTLAHERIAEYQFALW